MRSWITGLLITVVWFPTLIWASPQAKIADIKWLEGNWVGSCGEFPMEAHYTSARGGFYELKSDGSLLARIEGSQDGQEIAEDLVFERAK